jgi:nitrite reductase/ring-hydroxylating ferredoxin subunit
MEEKRPLHGRHTIDQESRRDITVDASRRRLLRLGWIGALVVFFGGQLWLLGRLFFATKAPRELTTQVVAGPIERFPPGSVTQFWKEGFVLIHSPTGFMALSQQCTHNRCNVQYLPEQHLLHCPCHGAQFSLSGSVLSGPATRALERFPTRVQEQRVVVDMSRPEGPNSAG